MSTSVQKKRIGFVELPDEALDLFGYYAQRPDWELTLVIGVDARSYAARMADVLHIPILERPNRPALLGCDRLIVGKKGGLMYVIQELTEGTDIEVVPLDAALLELAAAHGKSQIVARPDFSAHQRAKQDGTPSKPASKPSPVPVPEAKPKAKTNAKPKAKTPPRNVPISAPKVASPKPPKPIPATTKYTSESTFDAGTLLGEDFRDKLGALSINTDGDQLLHEILKMAVRVTHADSGSIMLLDETGKRLRIAVADGLPHWVLAHSQQEVGKGISGTVFATGMPRRVHGHLAQSSSADVRPGLREAACVPIMTKEGPIGVLNVSVESENTMFGDNVIGLLNMFAREASGAVLKAINLRKLTGTIHREAVLRQVERLMSLQETFPSRFRSVGEVVGQSLGADYAHCFIVDSEGKELVLFSSAMGTATLNTKPQPLNQGFLGWILRHGGPEVLESSSGTTGDGAAMAYLPLICGRPHALLVFDMVPLKDNSAVNVLNFLTEIKEVIEAYIALEDAMGKELAS